MVSQAPPIRPSSTLATGGDLRFIGALAVGLILFIGSVTMFVLSGELEGVLFNSPETWCFLAVFFFIFGLRCHLWWRYRPIELRQDVNLPSLTVVIPAFNEGANVRTSIASVLRSNYPTDKLQLIVVDDGSTDDTWTHIQQASKAHGDGVLALRLPRNKGKRHALYEGFSAATGDVVATLDSDSTLRPDSLRNLVAPMEADPTIAAVAGKVLVQNRHQNILTRMLGVRYILGFDFVRAYQSELRTVWCCPGALQAYRRNVIATELDAWLNQQFLGARCTNGDDHALTNTVLRLGYDSVYQSNAIVETIVPKTYRQLTRMFTRWGRSATREGLRALRFASGRAAKIRGWKGAFMLVDAILQPVGILGRLLALGGGLWIAINHPLALATAAALTGLFALVYAAVFLRSERSRDWIFCVCYAYFALIALAWVQPYATMTVRGNKWLTR